MQHSDIPVRVGDVLAGKFEVEAILGAGAMGVVVAAKNLELRRRVALKFMRPDLTSPALAARFMREARAAAALHSEHVCRVLDVARLPCGSPYIVMEYLEGMDLGALLRERGALAVGDAASYLAQVCEAMDEAHRRGIVHRDLKPANLFLTRRPEGELLVKVLDFGVSKAVLDLEPGESTPSSQMVIGSPAYMAPEQIRAGCVVDGRTDIWAMGVILYQLTVGRLPFEAANVFALACKILDEEIVWPSRLRVGLPAELDAIVMRCLARDRIRRYPTARALADALVQLAEAQPDLARGSRAALHALLDDDAFDDTDVLDLAGSRR